MENKKQIRFPTIIGLLILTMGVFGGSYLSRLNQNKQGRASGTCQPVNIQVSNLTYNSAYISFFTDKTCQSSISIEDMITSDIKGDGEYKVHYFHINNLSENRSYKYKIISAGETIEGENFSFKTLNKPETSGSESDLAWGKILDTNGEGAKNILLYLNIPGLSSLSAISNSEGNWHIPLSSSQVTPDINISEEIIVFDDQAKPTILTWNTSSNDPIPDITLGSTEIREIPKVESEKGVFEDNSKNQGSVSVGEFTIENPNEGETINIDVPEFFGKSIPKTKIQIELNSEQTYSGETVSNEDGKWTWTSPGKLEPGEHTITVSYTNPETNIVEKITRSFVVYASDGGLGFSATSSAKISPSITPTPTNYPSPTPTPSPEPTNSPTPTEVVRVAKVESSNKTPVTGGVSYTATLVVLGLSIFIIGKRIHLSEKK